MCPLRVILIFLSTVVAGFFLLKNLVSQHQVNHDDDGDSRNNSESSTSTLQLPSNSVNRSPKVCEAIGRGFWTCVDMASGRYLWRNLVSSSTSKRAD
ncbi:hypothetical protein LguiA_020788 [Lonicera macranthoides]